MNARDQCVNEILLAGSDDWVYLAEALRIVEVNTGEHPSSAMRITLDIVRELLEGDLVQVGDVTDVGFQAWKMSTDECLRRIEAECEALGREPSLGEICWLQNTEAGNRIVKNFK